MIAVLIGACGGGRSALGVADGAAGSTTLAAGSGGNSGGNGSGGADSGGMGSGGVGGGGRGATGGGVGGSISNDGGNDTAELNSHGDCVIADTVSNTATGTGCKPIYDDQLAMPCPPYLPYRGPTVRTGTCGSFLIFGVFDEFGLLRCFYDGSTRRLVAEHVCTDTYAYCGRRALCTWAGPDIGACYTQFSDSLPTQICPRPDAGTD